MRYMLIMILLGGLAGAPLLAQEEEGDAKQAEKKEAVELNVYEATFTGMTWGSWADNVMFTLWRLDGDKEVEVDRITGVATITMEDGKTLTRESVEKLFKKSMYELTDFEHIKGPDLKTQAFRYRVTIEDMLNTKESAEEIKKALLRLDGVASVEVDVETEVATVVMEEDAKLEKEPVEKALVNAGYTLTKLEQVETESPPEEDETQSDDG